MPVEVAGVSKIMVYPNKHKLIDAAIEKFIHLSNHAIHKRGIFSAALAGGGTPSPLYSRLAIPENQGRMDWSRIHLFWGDERHVPPDHADSNYRMVREQLLTKISIPEENVHRVPAEMEVRMAAFSYEESLRNFFGSEWPRFDLVILGMGEDGHTASLFPHSAGLNEKFRWFIANYAPDQSAWRLTLTKPAINAARQIHVLVSGAEKAHTVAEVLTGPVQPEDRPIQMIKPDKGEMVWMMDSEAAGELPPDVIVETFSG